MTLHLNGDMKEFWGVTGHYSAIFAHPTLLDLTLSSANILEDTSKDLQGIKTPLKRLVLDECNLSIEGLQGILSLPRALETLYIGEQGDFLSRRHEAYLLWSQARITTLKRVPRSHQAPRTSVSATLIHTASY